MCAYFHGGVPMQSSTAMEVYIFFSKFILCGIVGGLFAWLISKALGAKPKSAYHYFWFLLCGMIHFYIEGHLFRADPGNDSILSNLWIEYSKGDIRYFSEDHTIFIIEDVTYIFLSAMCILTSVLCLVGSNFRYVTSLIASCFQIYGVIIYYYTGIKAGNVSQSARYKLYYFYMANLPWLVIPALVIVNSSYRINSLTKESSASAESVSKYRKNE